MPASRFAFSIHFVILRDDTSPTELPAVLKRWVCLCCHLIVMHYNRLAEDITLVEGLVCPNDSEKHNTWADKCFHCFDGDYGTKCYVMHLSLMSKSHNVDLSVQHGIENVKKISHQFANLYF